MSYNTAQLENDSCAHCLGSENVDELGYLPNLIRITYFFLAYPAFHT